MMLHRRSIRASIKTMTNTDQIEEEILDIIAKSSDLMTQEAMSDPKEMIYQIIIDQHII